ncbi:acyl-CoA dehydrogenase family protein [Streptomyces sp. NBC_00083]|uniref:acyl-CoA dehydrogenase family protein n=1 Tax=Streptomyces sp. NBC_00083 TaxID=2975647 RepID=UPI00225B85B1|nr:acyl-CoA dehydrogenase family protein [Streptomyces sp. NBC_00083]MCX5383030.1 acyl-CoA/acyl-ACP dehydrogenase [Streptomyces sp. NBC_00083]
MRFLLTSEQRDFTRSLDAMLTAADTPSAVRAWGAGDAGPGRALWSRAADAGILALAAPGAYEDVGPLPVELALACVELGRHAAPGPYVETVAAAALLGRLAELGEPGPAKRLLPPVVSGACVASVLFPGAGPYALDADTADAVLVVSAQSARTRRPGGPGPELRLAPGHGPVQASADPARRLSRPLPGGELLAAGPPLADAVAYATGWARLAAAGQCLGLAQALLDRTVAYVKQRIQFGAPIGSFQAVKHRLADTLVAVEFARPLLFGAALSLAPADVAAAKVTAGEAAYAAARTALQLHGAVGYTQELDLSLWLRKARPLRDAWGTPGACRKLVLAG